MPVRRTPGLPAIALDRRSTVPLYRQIYEGYRTAILEQRLRAGQRMPSTRSLADELGLSRIPVLNAFEQLIAEGYLEAKIGAGTYVSGSLPIDGPGPSARSVKRTLGTRASPRAVARMRPPLPEEIPHWFSGAGAFKVGDAAVDEFPFTVWSRLVSRHAHRINPSTLRYGPSLGHDKFRAAIADYLRTTRAMHCEADQVMVVSGSQQALSLCAQVLFDPGDEVWIEEPGYFGAQAALATTGANLMPVPVDSHGMDVSAGIALAPNAKAAYVTPSHQYPLGATMEAARRLQLLSWAESHGAWIIEDDYDSEYRYESLPVAALQGLDRDDRVIYVGTFSKVLFPALRLGYIVIPPDLVTRFKAVRRAIDISPPTFMQAVMADFLSEGHFALHIRRMRRCYRERRSALVAATEEAFGRDLRILGAEAGLHLVVELPPGIKDVALARAAAEADLLTMPLSACYVGPATREGLVLGYGSLTIPEIRVGVRRLQEVVEGLQRDRRAKP